MRTYPWAASRIGPVVSWPQSLRTAIGICLHSRAPTLIWWGRELVVLYNDAARPLLGGRHPQALARPGREVFPEVWEVVGPALRAVLAGDEPTGPAAQLPLDRGGPLAETHLSLSPSPIYDESGGVGGVFTTLTETTQPSAGGSVPAHDGSPALADPFEDDRPHILIVDDSPDLHERATRILGMHYTLTVVPDGAGALAAAARQLPDLVLTDVVGSEPAASELVRSLREDPRTHAIPLIVVAAGPGPHDEGIERIADDYLVRPFASRELLARVRTQIELGRLRRIASERSLHLHALSVALSGALTPAEVATAILRHGCAAVRADAGVVALVSEDRAELELIDAVGYPPAMVQSALRTLVADERPLSDVVRLGEPSFFESQAVAAERYSYLALLQPLADIHAWANLPLALDGRTIGVLGVSFRAPRSFSRDERAFLMTLAGQCAQALDRARLYVVEQRARAGAEQAARRIAQLQDVTASLSTALTIDQVVSVAIDRGIAALGAAAGAVVLLTGDGTELAVAGAAGYPADVLEPWHRFSIDADVPIAEAVRAGRSIWLESPAARAARYPLLAAQTADTSYGAWAALPIAVGDRIAGALGLSFAQPQQFGEEDRRLASNLVQQCAQAIERARLYEAERQARADAESAVRVRDTFFSVAAHELRTPLTVLLGQIQLLERRLLRDAAADERQRRSVQTIVSQARRLNRMVTALLDISRIEQGLLRLDQTPFDLIELLHQVSDEVQSTLSDHTVRLEAPPGPVIVEGDSLRMEQVLQNLIGNAVKYSPAGGEVRVQVEAQSEAVRVSVTDRGIGIPPDALPQLFTRFYRAANVERLGISGMGIGLYVVRQIVTLHGGTVEAVSREGQGSSFTIVLPLARPRQELA